MLFACAPRLRLLFVLPLSWQCHQPTNRFRTFTPTHFRGAHGVILVYDITDAVSFRNLRQWLQDCDQYVGNAPLNKLLVGNKCDLPEKRAVEFGTAKKFAETLGVPFVETSAKDSTNVVQAFTQMVTDILERVKNEQQAAAAGGTTQDTVVVGTTASNKQESTHSSACPC
eukprot:TRINITY_DN1800_c0_g1_i1.p2 TRINITY_DN1800_c0_g1~~TRINITY_DN1800_c0_g1_i1.p2  ORF type:complete len:170 (-),score=47.73 TRINITY_DN1800_c0_g1_i1:37-546(-)